MAVTGEEIVRSVRNLGVPSGSLFVAHVSLKRFGRVAGGAEAVVEALIEVAGSEGTAVMPAFSSGDPDPFDAKRSPSRVGRVSETFRRHPRAHRSFHPTHSVAAIGRQADGLVAGHDRTTAFGAGSPLDRLVDWGGFALLFGVDHTRNSTVHIAEMRAGVGGLFERTVRVESEDGTVREVVLKEMPGHSGGFGRIAEPLRRKGLTREGRIGDATVSATRASDVVSVAMELLRDDPAALLCGDPACPRCSEARRKLTERTKIGEASR